MHISYQKILLLFTVNTKKCFNMDMHQHFTLSDCSGFKAFRITSQLSFSFTKLKM